MMSWAAKFGFTKIPLMVKPIEEVKFEEPVMTEVEFLVKEDHTFSKAPSVEQAIEKPLVLPPTSSPLGFDVEEEFDLSNFMFEEEGDHSEKISNQEDTMEE
ncbi:hypothetical protein KI387_005647, partial [Taxus chinensis]